MSNEIVSKVWEGEDRWSGEGGGIGDVGGGIGDVGGEEKVTGLGIGKVSGRPKMTLGFEGHEWL